MIDAMRCSDDSCGERCDANQGHPTCGSSPTLTQLANVAITLQQRIQKDGRRASMLGQLVAPGMRRDMHSSRQAYDAALRRTAQKHRLACHMRQSLTQHLTLPICDKDSARKRRQTVSFSEGKRADQQEQRAAVPHSPQSARRNVALLPRS